MPVKLYTGKGILEKHKEQLAELGGRCFVITGKSSAVRSGALADIQRIFEETGTEYEIYDGISVNPSVSSCIEAGRKAYAFQASYIMGIGGGSPLDAAKAAAVFAANPELDEKGLYAMTWNRVLPTVLVGTTAGTGSEVTKVSVLTNSEGRKKSVHHDLLYPVLAFGDPAYTASMGRTLTLTTGTDALTHLTESFFSKKANDISRACSIEGIRNLIPLLEKAADHFDDLTEEDRETIYNASILGGMAIAATGTVFPHNVGYYFTEEYQIPHGFASALLTDDLLSFEETCDREYADAFYERTGISHERFRKLLRKVLPEYEIHLSEETLQDILPRWQNNGTVKNTRGDITSEEIGKMLRRKFPETE